MKKIRKRANGHTKNTQSSSAKIRFYICWFPTAEIFTTPKSRQVPPFISSPVSCFHWCEHKWKSPKNFSYSPFFLFSPVNYFRKNNVKKRGKVDCRNWLRMSSRTSRVEEHVFLGFGFSPFVRKCMAVRLFETSTNPTHTQTDTHTVIIAISWRLFTTGRKQKRKKRKRKKKKLLSWLLFSFLG